MSLIGKPHFNSEQTELIYLLFNSNWEEDKTVDRYWNSKSGFGKPICDRCRCHWWSHWICLRHNKDVEK